MYIDIHSHVYKNHPRGIKGIPDFCTPEELIFRYDELNIEKGVLLPIVSPEIYLPQSNEDILEIAAAYPDRFIPFCNKVIANYVKSATTRARFGPNR